MNNNVTAINNAAADIAAVLSGNDAKTEREIEVAAPRPVGGPGGQVRATEGDLVERAKMLHAVLPTLSPALRASTEAYEEGRERARARAVDGLAAAGLWKPDAVHSKAPGWTPPPGTFKFSATRVTDGWRALINDRADGPTFREFGAALDYAQAQAKARAAAARDAIA